MRENSGFVLLLMLGLSLLVGCSNSVVPECGEILRKSAISPDGVMKADWVSVQCGATTGDATWVYLIGVSDDRLRRKPVAIFEGDIAKTEWRSDGLYVFYGDAIPFETGQVEGGPPVHYEPGSGL